MRTPDPAGSTRRFPRVAAAVALLLAVTAVAACAPEPSPGPAPAPSSAAAGTAGPSAPVLVPDGTAADNLPLFAHVVAQVTADGGDVAGRRYIDALAAAGFPREHMQLTADTTTVGDAVDALQFSVLWAGECLVGQVGPSTPGAAAVVMPELPDGGCLVGTTRPLDW